MPDTGINVIALISGGKDSFYSVLHCIEHGHKVVALANLFPATEGTSSAVQAIDPTTTSTTGQEKDDEGQDEDLNSFMYQTVGHEIIPLYAAATGLPLYRQPICGGAERHERDYAFDAAEASKDETESMTSLLKSIMERHPEANAVSAGAILSTYQRTRVESVALRLGLVPLAYLWKYPTLPPPTTPADDAQLLKDMAKAGLEARIIKVASAGLTEDHLWERVSGMDGAERVKAALRKFGTSGGAVLGEGGEFETVVLDGPSRLFKKKISVASESRKTIQEGGGTSWLMLRNAVVEDKEQQAGEGAVQIPKMLDARFNSILDALAESAPENAPSSQTSSSLLGKQREAGEKAGGLLQWTVMASPDQDRSTIEAETSHVVAKVRDLLAANSLDTGQVSNTVIILRDMSDFPKINAQYGQLFTKANPPSRVTISCGDLLPSGCSIAIYLTVDTTPVAQADRQGLHVQSRSYWAPANIGPYSQAVGIPISVNDGETGLRSWSIAGQIPLIPSTMVLPEPSETSQRLQTTLSLQHLWRIGVDLDIQFWTSAVAFFARSTSEKAMQKNAVAAGRAWRLAHGSPDEEEDDDEGPDLWDLKFNPKYMSLAGTEQTPKATPLPDWSALVLSQQNEPASGIPPVFSVEVEELPRQAGVEWHAHVGLSQVEESSIEVFYTPQVSNDWSVWHAIARGQNGTFLHTVLARDVDTQGTLDFDVTKKEMATAHQEALQSLNIQNSTTVTESPYLTYVDTGSFKDIWAGALASRNELPFAMIPCRSMWSSAGKRLNVISLYKKTLKP